MDVKNLPNLPTDNLYKFITLFCIALMFSSAYGTVSVYDSHRAQYERVKDIEFALVEVEEETEKSRLQTKYVQQEISRIKSDQKFFLYVTMTAFLLSIIGAFVGFVLWRNNLQKYFIFSQLLFTMNSNQEHRDQTKGVLFRLKMKYKN